MTLGSFRVGIRLAFVSNRVRVKFECYICQNIASQFNVVEKKERFCSLLSHPENNHRDREIFTYANFIVFN